MVETNSRRVCALLLEGDEIKLLYVCVYLPYEKGNDNVDEYLYQLSFIGNVITQFTDCHIVIGGDFNTDFTRQT